MPKVTAERNNPQTGSEDFKDFVLTGPEQIAEHLFLNQFSITSISGHSEHLGQYFEVPLPHLLSKVTVPLEPWSDEKGYFCMRCDWWVIEVMKVDHSLALNPPTHLRIVK